MIARRPGVLLGVALVVALSGTMLGIFGIRLDADTNSLIGDQRPFMQIYRDYLERYGDLESIYVVVDAGDPIDSERAQLVVDELTRALKTIPGLETVRSTITAKEQWILASHAMPQDLLDDLILAAPAIEALLGDEDVETLLARANRRLDEVMTPLGPDAVERRTSSAVAFLLLDSLAGGSAEESPASVRQPGYLTSATGRMHFIEIMPKKDFESFAVIDGPLKRIRETIASASTKHSDIEIGLTGKPVLQADELATSARDMTRGTILALIAISIVFMFYFREWKRPLLAVLAFLLAFGWTYGAATLIVGRLNLLSMVFMLVLVGAGIDYGIHVLARWRESRTVRTVDESLAHIMKTAVTGNLTGAVTSAGVFFLALLTSFQGLRELGIIAGLGLLFCGLSMAVVLPALLKLSERDGLKTSTNRSPRDLNPISRHSRTRDRAVLALAVTSLLPLALIAFQNLRFESNLLELQSKDLDSVHWERALFEDDSSGSWFGAVVVDDLADIPEVIRKAREREDIGPVRSALDVIAVPDDERKTALATLATLDIPLQTGRARPATDEPAVVRNGLRKTSRALTTMLELGGDSIPVQRRAMIETILNRIDEDMIDDDATMMTELKRGRARAAQHLQWTLEGSRRSSRSVLPDAVRARFSAEDGTFAVLMQPERNIWDPEAMTDFVTSLRSVSPKATGVPITQHESIREMHHAFLVMAWGSILVVGFAIWLDFRTVGETMACLLALGLAMSWTLGGLAVFGVSINLANFFAIPILIGLGADSAIHVLHRWRLIRTGEERTFGETLNAVTLTACTTGLGFGTLVFAHHQGLQSLGWVMVMGSMSTFFSTTIMLPAGLRLLGGSKVEYSSCNGYSNR